MIRLVLSVFICFFAGSLLVGMLYNPHPKVGASYYLVSGTAFGCLAAALVLTRLPWKLETAVTRLGILMGCFYAGIVLGAWSQHLAAASSPTAPTTGQMVLSVLGLQGVSMVFVGLFLRDQQLRWSEAFGLANRRARAVLAGAGASLLFLPLGWRLQQISVDLLLRLAHTRPEEQLPVQTLRNAAGWGDRALLGVITILLVPVAEELLFRGILYPWVKQLGYPRLALWGSSLFFAAFHLSLPTFLPLFVLAMILAALYEWSDNLLAPITAHALFNGLNFALLYLYDKKL